jgi:N-glycosylase/DNA lyase
MCEFDFTEDDVNGPLNLEDTILSAQTSEPEWVKNGQKYENIQELNGTPVKYSVSQKGSADHFTISVQYISSGSDTVSQKDLRSHLEQALGLSDDLIMFYNAFSSDRPLSSTFTPLRGLRLMRGSNLYESLVCSILSQNNSAKRWNGIARLLMRHYGRQVQFSDGTSSFLFPTPQVIARLTPRELQRTTSMGYRAKSVVTVSRMILNKDLDLETLINNTYENAMDALLELYGVGPKVADCFLLYGAGQLKAAPVDVWIHRIVTGLYFKGRKMSRPTIALFLRNRFGNWAGYVQLYLFHYARRAGFGKKTA